MRIQRSAISFHQFPVTEQPKEKEIFVSKTTKKPTHTLQQQKEATKKTGSVSFFLILVKSGLVSKQNVHSRCTQTPFTCQPGVTWLPKVSGFAEGKGSCAKSKVRISTTAEQKRRAPSISFQTETTGAFIETPHFHRNYPFSVPQLQLLHHATLWHHCLHDFLNGN